MAEHVVRITWLRQGEALMYDEAICEDERQAWRVFHRLSEFLRTLTDAKPRQENGGLP